MNTYIKWIDSLFNIDNLYTNSDYTKIFWYSIYEIRNNMKRKGYLK